MLILKHALIDLLVTLFILAAVLTQAAWMWWVVIVYTSLMLILKLVDYSGAGFSSFKKTGQADVPNWPFHLLYGANVLILTYFAWYITAGLWALIWLLSWLKIRQKRQREQEHIDRAKAKKGQ